MITLDKAIEYARDAASRPTISADCAEQIAEWLEELRDFRTATSGFVGYCLIKLGVLKCPRKI